MARAFTVDERLRKGIGRGEFATVIWPSRGQEAIPAGIGEALTADDRLVTTYRGLHDLVCKGVPLTEVMGEVLASTIGASGGKGGTMHITAPDHGVMLTTGIVGAGVPVGVGLALAAKQQGSDRVVVVTFGDGATNTGSFHEGLNLAAVWKLPVIFVCQNNLYAELTPVEDTMNIAEVRERALAYNIPGLRIDGNDPEEVFATVTAAADRARAGEGPTLIEAVTFRFKGHYVGDTMKYMPKEQLTEAKAKDPMVTYRRKLIDEGLLTVEELDDIDRSAVAEVEEAVVAIAAAGRPGADALENDLYADMTGVPA
ncbi:thiamine pyrophosphate-dependent dehydrogenase E1 component subunit alpha [Rhodococcus sp. BP-149]|uniref:thiamine pyrophosphate-dependent dehydrogenase E1 component subunit alpha n=1 Tax=unclassified Rhodococcus (in: high G+C Gram-positive bacteria) TaxID=192944 RepID=UPI001C9AB8CA|nr:MULTISPECIES: thiamine pyrophosphate-dependent dehydrogenase E1 component subunit alpha [unclassified Rhodococcus (in: high G+C Gram-positive bacteria)]MBY6687812.1 thiamine pyrophosphate-dependent dehydrogenase E1 component subunit alpha [Rhodococcus sp. BP-288]MBY6696077.1 thiamine pyrophosphate-dependent dehydrogenase E1 component subunit alpha [Rhodococcus sp. BP-188]MBY6700674.1 thiamine pyrophosphate-dependent dehydrogenase E1 component subunit alpha [Rhodococcus sp. BP-285]MBY6705071.